MSENTQEKKVVLLDIESKLAKPETLQKYYDSKTEDQLEALKILWAAEMTSETPEILYEDDNPQLMQSLNMNDTFGWALAWGEHVPDDKLVEVAKLFRTYGRCGLIYWVSEQNNQTRSEFPAINRQIDFVRQEEKLWAEADGDTSKWAYQEVNYCLGGEQS
ncbi:MAG: hypothetical protein AAGA46_03315 [Cyanobacteria bacterium P01_F01_bin.13]